MRRQRGGWRSDGGKDGGMEGGVDREVESGERHKNRLETIRRETKRKQRNEEIPSDI